MSRYILLVEDNSDDETLTVLALKRASLGADVVVVRDGAEALGYLFGSGRNARGDTDELPELVLLDLKLPKIDGLEVLKRIRSERSTRLLPVVIFTSSAEESDLRRSYEGGASSYVRKPVDFEEFRRTIQTIGGYWLSVNEPPPAPASL